MSDRVQKPFSSRENNWQRWQMDELTESRTAHSSAGQMAKVGSQINLAQVREQARRAAREEGYQRGFAEGREAGFNEGRTKGHATGMAEGHTEGLQQGRALAEEEYQQRLQTVLNPLVPLAQHFDEALQQLSDELAASLLELAFATGHQLARERLDAQPQRIADIVRDLLHKDPMLTGKPRVWLHPDDLGLVREQIGNELDAAGWTLQPDPQILRGGCRASSDSGEIDATWEARWDALTSRVRRRHQHNQSARPEISE